MRKSLILLIVGGLIVGSLGAPAMAKKKKPKPAATSVDQKFFLRSTGCSVPDENFDYLSLTDADEATECFYTAGGARYEIGKATGDACAPDPTTGGQRCAFASKKTATRYFDAIDGVPIVLDTAKAITGSIWTSGGACVTSLTPCSPAGLGLGNATTDVSVVGKIGEKEVVIGELSETYQIVPGTVHEIKIDFKIDASLAGQVFETIEVQTWQGGMAIGHHIINTNGATSSFISVPSLVTK